ncbi:DNA packaging protein [Chelatococcus reniformis]|uniref:Terminase small subunit, Nu1 n=1 Tax=Chelatococcus reniformis TaxID=1494448 RepID=A0A916XFK6_9HYPH|nr:DNA packaging protein [Chelatococcus reniformis]GGC68489.1 hypothetical protein GCM10010994_28840 [Chelatococcus reniformis]
MTGVTGEQLAVLFDCSERTIRDLAKRGAVVRTGRDRYDAPASVTSYVKHLREGAAVDNDQLDPDHERARKDRALADKTELQNAVTRGELVPAEEVHAAWVEMIGVARSRLLAMPSKLGPVLAVMSTPTEVQSAVEAEVTAALEELAGVSVEAVDDPGDDAAGASGAADGDTMEAAS